MRFPLIVATLAALLAPLPASHLAAQVRRPQIAVPFPLEVFAHRSLQFGSVLAGIPSSVNVHDPRHSALFEIQGPPETSVRIELVLPASLTAEGGATLPINFGPGDGFADFSRGRPPRGTLFNPHTPLISTLGPNGRLFLSLGGTVLPARPQQGGLYRATIFLTIYDLGS
jgi:hypothetical protein